MPKRNIKNNLLKFVYPQRVFGKEIAHYIQTKLPETKLIIDCPCGNGETSWHFSKITNVHVIANDISKESIEIAKINYSNSNIEFNCKDIKYSIDELDKNCTFCLINSLFLFPNATEILNLLQQKLSLTKSTLLIIIPNTKGKNFLWFQKNHPNQNKLILDFEDITPFFEKLNFKVGLIKPICYTHHFNRNDIKLFSIFWGVYLNCLNIFQTALKIGKPNYFFIALST